MSGNGANGALIAKRTVGAAALVIMAGMIISRILGYGRFKVIAYYFGRNWMTDSFVDAFAVPDLIYTLLSGGALTASFIPVFTEYLVAKKEKEAWHIANSVGNLMLLAVAACVVVGMVFTPTLVSLLVPGLKKDPRSLAMTVDMCRIIFPMVLMTSTAALFNGILHSTNHFGAPAVAWCLHNIGIILFAVFLHERLGIFSLCWGVLAGATSMVLVQAPFVRAKGFRFRPVLDLKHPGVSRILRNFAPAVLGLSMTTINLFILPITFGSMLPEGSVTALQFGVRLLLLPLGLFGSALSMAIFPTLSRQAGEGRKGEFRETLVRGISTTFVFSVPSTVFLIVMATPVTRFLFQGNEFTEADCVATALGVAYFSIGLVGHTAVQVAARGFYAEKDTMTPFSTGFLSVALVSVPGCWLLSRTGLGHGGVALGISLSALANMFALFVMLRRRMPEVALGRVGVSFAKTAAASAGLLAVCWYLREPLAGYHPGIQVMATGALGGGVFLALAYAMKVEGFVELAGGMKKRFLGGRG